MGGVEVDVPAVTFDTDVPGDAGSGLAAGTGTEVVTNSRSGGRNAEVVEKRRPVGDNGEGVGLLTPAGAAVGVDKAGLVTVD